MCSPLGFCPPYSHAVIPGSMSFFEIWVLGPIAGFIPIFFPNSYMSSACAYVCFKVQLYSALTFLAQKTNFANRLLRRKCLQWARSIPTCFESHLPESGLSFLPRHVLALSDPAHMQCPRTSFCYFLTCLCTDCLTIYVFFFYWWNFYLSICFVWGVWLEEFSLLADSRFML